MLTELEDIIKERELHCVYKNQGGLRDNVMRFILVILVLKKIKLKCGIMGCCCFGSLRDFLFFFDFLVLWFLYKKERQEQLWIIKLKKISLNWLNFLVL